MLNNITIDNFEDSIAVFKKCNIFINIDIVQGLNLDSLKDINKLKVPIILTYKNYQKGDNIQLRIMDFLIFILEELVSNAVKYSQEAINDQEFARIDLNLNIETMKNINISADKNLVQFEIKITNSSTQETRLKTSTTGLRSCEIVANALAFLGVEFNRPEQEYNEDGRKQNRVVTIFSFPILYI